MKPIATPGLRQFQSGTRKVRDALLMFTMAASLLAAAEPRTVVVFGDSITQGGALPKNDRTNAWVNVVERTSQGRLKMVNEGKGGRPTDSVKEFDAMLVCHPRADALVIALGTNDSRDTTDKCVPKAVANIQAMIARARKAWGEKLPVLLVGPPNINKSALGPTKPIANEREAKLRELGEAFARLAKDQRCEYGTLFGVVPESSMTKDGVHPDSAGNAAIASAMLPKIRAIVTP
ncbi:MAG: SGNH/GDSL hydrolase family protein [Verrucomicrobiota bacterium]